MRIRDFAVPIIVAATLMWPSAAHADSNAVLVDDDSKTELTFSDDGDATAKVTLSNAGDAFQVKALASDAQSKVCVPDPKPIDVDGHVQKAITVTFNDCPSSVEQNTGFKLVDATKQTHVLFTLTATPPTKPNPNWSAVIVI